jgi:hypothetical protein
MMPFVVEGPAESRWEDSPVLALWKDSASVDSLALGRVVKPLLELPWRLSTLAEVKPKLLRFRGGEGGSDGPASQGAMTTLSSVLVGSSVGLYECVCTGSKRISVEVDIGRERTDVVAGSKGNRSADTYISFTPVLELPELSSLRINDYSSAMLIVA